MVRRVCPVDRICSRFICTETKAYGRRRLRPSMLTESFFHGIIQPIGQHACHDMCPDPFTPADQERSQGERRFDFVKGFFHPILAPIPRDHGLRGQLLRAGIGLKTGNAKHALRRVAGIRIDLDRDLPGLDRLTARRPPREGDRGKHGLHDP